MPDLIGFNNGETGLNVRTLVNDIVDVLNSEPYVNAFVHDDNKLRLSRRNGTYTTLNMFAGNVLQRDSNTITFDKNAFYGRNEAPRTGNIFIDVDSVTPINGNWAYIYHSAATAPTIVSDTQDIGETIGVYKPNEVNVLFLRYNGTGTSDIYYMTGLNVATVADINNIGNVAIEDPENNQVLVYNPLTLKWENRLLASTDLSDSARLVRNSPDFGTVVNTVVTLTEAEHDALMAANETDANTLYFRTF
jgi:hypothetical protein